MMSAAPATPPYEITLSHVSFRQASLVGTWTEACIVDGALVVESSHPLSDRDGVLVRLSGQSGRSLAVTSQPPVRIQEPGQPDLWVLPLGLAAEELHTLDEAPETPQDTWSHHPRPARPGLGRTATFSLLLSGLALAGAAALTIAVGLG